nr:glycosyltransferase [Sporolactobacillus vineae]
MKQNIHIIVAAAKWTGDRLKYRRHRLAEYLDRLPDTDGVIWVCPSPEGEDPEFTDLRNGISQWAISDLLPQKFFRFGRYLDLFYQKKTGLFAKQLEHMEGNFHFFLWYTCPIFPKLAEQFPWTRVIYDCSDLWAAPIGGGHSPLSVLRRKLIARSEQRVINAADTLFCTSDYLHDRVSERAAQAKQSRIFTIENGVSFSRFSEMRRATQVLPEHFQGTILGYIGGIKPKLDFALIREAARRKPEWLFLFVGPDGTGPDSLFKKLREKKNVLWTGSVSPEEVPQYTQLVTIGIMPYKPSVYNQAVFPLKLFEFLAAGKPAVGLHLPSTKKYDQAGVYRELEDGDTAAFIKVCEEMEQAAGMETFIRKRQELAGTKDWNALFARMDSLIQQDYWEH